MGIPGIAATVDLVTGGSFSQRYVQAQAERAQFVFYFVDTSGDKRAHREQVLLGQHDEVTHGVDAFAP